MAKSFINDYLKGIKPYKTSSHKVWEVKPEHRQEILKLDWNEATVAPSPNVVKRLNALLKEPCFLNLYPNTSNQTLLELLGDYTGLPIQNIQYFASSDVVHEYIARIYLENGKKILIQSPAYDNFRLTAQANGAKVYFSEVNADFSFDENRFEQDIKSIKPNLVYICSPNNPIGYVTGAKYIEHLLNAFPDIMFLIDEAYVEFSTKPSVAPLVTKYDNIIVTRTMSKAFALANMRFGYVLSSAQNIQNINSIRNPKNINTFTQEAIIATLQDVEYTREYVKEVNSAKKWFINAVNKLGGIHAYQSEANFVLMQFDSYGLKANMYKWLKQHDIFIREISQSPIVYKCLRITIGTKQQMEYVVRVMTDFYKQKTAKKNNTKIALFDFCDTMVDFQTGNRFLRYIIKHHKIGWWRKFVYNIKHVWYKHLLGKDVEKAILLQCCRGIDRAEMENLALNYYFEIIRPHLIKATVDKLLYYQKSGYSIFVVSGGFDMYIKYFAEEFGVDGVFSTRVQFQNDVCTGKYDGVDCMGENKIKILQNYFGKDSVNGVAFSDSITDLPLLKFVTHGFAVGPTKDSVKWANPNKLEEIVYVPKEYYKI